MKLKCNLCKKDFLSRSTKRNFCSRKCFDKFELDKMMKKCLWCGVTFKAVMRRKNIRRKFCSKSCMASSYYGKKSKVWNGGIISNHPSGYNLEFIGKDKYRLQHRLVMETHLCRKLSRYEAIHHKNHNKKDNRLENLELMSLSDHQKLHMKERKCKNVLKEKTLSSL